MLYVLPFLLAMVVTMLWLPLFARVAVRWRIVDQPGERKVHSVPIPRVGGVAMAIGVLVSASIILPLGSPDRYFLIAAGIVALFGGLDDRFDLDYRIKIAGQLFAALIVVGAGGIQIHEVTLDARMILPQWFAVPLTVFFLVGITNAINLVDGLDGLAGGTTFLSLCALAMLAYGSGQFTSAALALTFAGAVLGFLRFNTFPASVFMGDAGSQLLGFAVGVLSLRATQSGTSAVSAATPILLLALPILDTLTVMAQRISEGRSPFGADKNHVHHKLLALGFDHHEAVMLIYAVQADLLLLAYWMRYESDLVIIGAVSVFFAVCILLLQLATRHRWQFHAVDKRRPQASPANEMAGLANRARLTRWTDAAAAAALAVYAGLIVGGDAAVSRDVDLLLVILLAAVGVCGLLFRFRPLSFFEKGTLYVAIAVLVYLDTAANKEDQAISWLIWAVILIAAAATLLRLRLSNDRRFELTPLDLIVVFVALVVPSLPGSISLPHGGALGIAKLVMLFYAVEMMVSRSEVPAVWLRIGTATAIIGLIVRPML
jgi:UDP-GlcNAc:undecaprenyl-phosphate/decaprenyl-phosphate GlcNAc-1-phosphate transferase